MPVWAREPLLEDRHAVGELALAAPHGREVVRDHAEEGAHLGLGVPALDLREAPARRRLRRQARVTRWKDRSSGAVGHALMIAPASPTLAAPPLRPPLAAQPARRRSCRRRRPRVPRHPPCGTDLLLRHDHQVDVVVARGDRLLFDAADRLTEPSGRDRAGDRDARPPVRSPGVRSSMMASVNARPADGPPTLGVDLHVDRERVVDERLQHDPEARGPPVPRPGWVTPSRPCRPGRP